MKITLQFDRSQKSQAEDEEDFHNYILKNTVIYGCFYYLYGGKQSSKEKKKIRRKKSKKMESKKMESKKMESKKMESKNDQ